jgi:hypothetical protein
MPSLYLTGVSASIRSPRCYFTALSKNRPAKTEHPSLADSQSQSQIRHPTLPHFSHFSSLLTNQLTTSNYRLPHILNPVKRRNPGFVRLPPTAKFAPTKAEESQSQPSPSPQVRRRWNTSPAPFPPSGLKVQLIGNQITAYPKTSALGAIYKYIRIYLYTLMSKSV